MNLTQERLRELLDYNPLTGVFVWKVNRYSTRIGPAVGSLLPTGYLQIEIGRKRHLVHRLAFLYIHGRWPVNQIDHKDGDRSNNRIDNLREATQSQNQMNTKLSPRNTSGFRGVSRSRGRYMATINAHHRFYFLGRFPTAQEAHAAYTRAAQKLHGEFFRAA